MGAEKINNGKDYWMADDKDPDYLAVSGKTKRKRRPQKMEFVRWGSRQLIDFLESIGKDTSNPINHLEVEAIVNDYVKRNNLTNPNKKKRIVCDERLISLFGKNSFPRVKIHEFLEKHLAEYQSDDDDFLNSSDEDDEKARKRQKVNEKDTCPKKRIQETPKSPFAAIIPANVKLLHLKKKLVEELYKDEATFERKLLGSYVKVKKDPNDFLQKNSHLLVQVTSVKRPYGENTTCSDILLEVSSMMDDIRICVLADSDLSEEECEDLRERIKSGSLKRPTTVEFQEKAELLHQDITKHWLDTELHSLQNRIERANEKGWRKELTEYLERRQLLSSLAEQKRLLLEVPTVIADELEDSAKPDEGHNDSPKSIVRVSSLVSTDDLDATQAVETPDIDNNKAPENLTMVQLVGMQKTVHMTEMIDVDMEEAAEAFSVDPQQQTKVELNFIPTTAVIEKTVHVTEIEKTGVVKKRVPTTEVIELSDDEEEVEKWYYVDPNGTVQGPFSLRRLKGWSKYFPPSFKVFENTGHFNPVLLSKLLLHS